MLYNGKLSGRKFFFKLMPLCPQNPKFKWPRKRVKSTLLISDSQWHWLFAGLDIQKMKSHRPLTENYHVA